MKNITIATCLGLLLSGCTSLGPKEPDRYWYSHSTKDEFTDEVECIVSTGSLYRNGIVYTKTGNYYPFIQEVDGELIVGVKSGGKQPIPVGNIQIRIDSLPAWNITTAETPSSLLGTTPPADPGVLKAMTENVPEDQKAIITNSYQSSMELMAQNMSTKTAASGDKARSILTQMLAGNTLKYRIVGFSGLAGAGKSTTGIVRLDNSLPDSLTICGISNKE